MSFFKNIFGNNDTDAGSENSHTSFWNTLRTSEDFQSAIQESYEKPVAIFKHSTRCHISKTVLANFEREVKNSEQDFSYYFLDLIAYRTLSNEIANQLNVTHQSPQLIILKDGEVSNHASHSAISLRFI